MGIEEGLVNLYPPNGDFSGVPSLVVGRDSELRASSLQLLVLFEEATLIHNDIEDPKELFSRTHVPSMSLKPLETDGLLRFISGKADEFVLAKLTEAKTVAQKYLVIRDSVALWKPLIISQMMARGKLPDPSLFDVIDAPLAQPDKVQQAIGAVPQPQRDVAKRLVEDSHFLYLNLLVIFSTLQELQETDTTLSENADHFVAMAPLGPGSARTEAMAAKTADTTNRLFRVVLDALFDQGIEFPQPTSLREVRNLRLNPDISAFRTTFLPWLDKLSSGNEKEERILRAEVTAAAKAFRRYPSAKRLSKWLSYLSLPLHLVPYLGSAVHVAAFGTERLADRWRDRSRWVPLAAALKEER
jgi:hypothetical protein